jgi:hypothetical protein
MVRVVVVVPGVLTTQAVRTLLWRFMALTRAWRRGACLTRVAAFARLTKEGRWGGFSATWTAPPPMIAPPQVQAQSLARAILTDMTAHLVFRFRCVAESPGWKIGFSVGLHAQMQRNALSASALTTKTPRNARQMAVRATCVPFEDRPG